MRTLQEGQAGVHQGGGALQGRPQSGVRRGRLHLLPVGMCSERSYRLPHHQVLQLPQQERQGVQFGTHRESNLLERAPRDASSFQEEDFVAFMSDPDMGGASGQQTPPSLVPQLTDTTFEQDVASKAAVLVMFYAPCEYHRDATPFR